MWTFYYDPKHLVWRLDKYSKPSPYQASYPGDHRAIEPPDPISNSAVKRGIADDSVGIPHVKVGHHQVVYKPPVS